MAGAQNVAAVPGSAKRTSCEGDSQTVTSPAGPGEIAMVVTAAASVAEEDEESDEPGGV